MTERKLRKHQVIEITGNKLHNTYFKVTVYFLAIQYIVHIPLCNCSSAGKLTL